MAKMNQKVSPLGLLLTNTPTRQEVLQCIEDQNQPGNVGLAFELQKMALAENGEPTLMIDPATKAPVTGKLVMIVQGLQPIGDNVNQVILMGHALSFDLGGQPIPLMDDSGQDIAQLLMKDAKAVDGVGIRKGDYVKLTCDFRAQTGELRTYVNNNEVSLLSLSSITGMNHLAPLPVPVACRGPLEDQPLTIAP